VPIIDPATISELEDSITVSSPYNPAFINGAKNLGGRWDPEDEVWVFTPPTKARAVDLVRATYGLGPKTVRATVDAYEQWRNDLIGDNSCLFFGGRTVLRRPTRDSRIILAEGVSIASGEFSKSGGSVRHPSLELGRGVMIEVCGVPEDHPDLASPWVKSIAESGGVDTRALNEERERLLKRLAEIERALTEDEIERYRNKPDNR